jgi:hypothetical protein
MQVMYSTMRYTVLEISKALSNKQVETVGRTHVSRGTFRSVCVDATAWGAHGVSGDDSSLLTAAGTGPDSTLGAVDLSAGYDGPCFVIALEVLDNLPHDKVVWEDDRDEGTAAGSWRQVGVLCGEHTPGSPPTVEEVVMPLDDDIIARTVQALQQPVPPLWSSLSQAGDDDASLSWSQRVVKSMSQRLGRMHKSTGTLDWTLVPHPRNLGRPAEKATFVPTGAALTFANHQFQSLSRCHVLHSMSPTLCACVCRCVCVHICVVCVYVCVHVCVDIVCVCVHA